MEWKTLLSEKRMRGSGKKQHAKKSDFRSEFEKDYHRIIGSASFRRLQDKTQVFPRAFRGAGDPGLVCAEASRTAL